MDELAANTDTAQFGSEPLCSDRRYQDLVRVLRLIEFFGLVVLICWAGVGGATDREFGHPLFRTFTVHDYGDAYEIYAVTEDEEGRMLFGCQDAILASDNNRWETIPAPETGYIRWLAVNSQGLVWFGSSAQIGYLARIDGKYLLVRVYHGSFGPETRGVVIGGQLVFSTETGLVIWRKGRSLRSQIRQLGQSTARPPSVEVY